MKALMPRFSCRRNKKGERSQICVRRFWVHLLGSKLVGNQAFKSPETRGSRNRQFEIQMKGQISATSSHAQLNATRLLAASSSPTQTRINKFLLLVHYIAQHQKLGDRCLRRYLDETRREEQMLDGKVLRTGESCKSQVAGEQEQKYSARPRI